MEYIDDIKNVLEAVNEHSSYEIQVNDSRSFSIADDGKYTLALRYKEGMTLVHRVNVDLDPDDSGLQLCWIAEELYEKNREDDDEPLLELLEM